MEMVSVIIPFRYFNSLTKSCLDSLRRQSYKNIEIITISDKVELKEKGIKHIKLEKLYGPGEKRNAGIKIAKGDILFFLDSDCIAKEDTIEKLIDVFKETGADAVSGKPLAARRGNLLGYITGLEYEDRFEQMGDGFVSTAATTCFGVKKYVFKKLKGFRDYSIKEAVGEDLEFSTRMTKSGFKIYHTNKMQVYHEHGSDSLLKYLYRQYLHSKYRAAYYKGLTDEYFTGKNLLSSIFLNIPETIRIFRKTNDIRVLVLLPIISLLRNVAWFFGLLSGQIEKYRCKIKYYLRPKKYLEKN